LNFYYFSINRRRLFKLGIFIIPLALVWSQCINFKKQPDPRGNAYAGSKSCESCHKDIYHSYLHTAHFMASQPANDSTIQGSFHSGANVFAFDSTLKVVMNKRDSGFYQMSYKNGKLQQSQRFDITFGGIKGQTYAYWFTNELFQLPISYVSNTNQWVNSPGYYPNKVEYERAITIKCLNCHTSGIKRAAALVPGFNGNNEGFDKNTLIYSVDCERCHGPASAHVKFHIENPDVKKAKYIATFSSLTREQKINMCAVCHSGADSRMLKVAFKFNPKDNIKYIEPVEEPDYQHIDVHGNQRGLLASSKCYINSNMDCSNCHDTHVNDRNNLALYTTRCMTCHNTANHNLCKLTDQLSSAVLKSNCISCHMPALPSKLIVAGNAGTLIHTHHIAIYPDQTKKVLAYLKTDKNIIEHDVAK
jgi:hypothetical protein